MNLNLDGKPSDYGDDLFMKEEQEAQLKMLTALGSAIKQQRQILTEKQDYVAKIEMKIQIP